MLIRDGYVCFNGRFLSDGPFFGFTVSSQTRYPVTTTPLQRVHVFSEYILMACVFCGG